MKPGPLLGPDFRLQNLKPHKKVHPHFYEWINHKEIQENVDDLQVS